MRSSVKALIGLAVGAVVLAAAACALLPLGGLWLNPVPTVLGAVLVAVLGWTIYHGFEGTTTIAWPTPKDATLTSHSVRERGIAKTLSLFASAESGSALSRADVAGLVRDTAARQLVLRGADPEAPFDGADGLLSENLLSLCRRSAAGESMPALSRRRLDAYLKEILAL